MLNVSTSYPEAKLSVDWMGVLGCMIITLVIATEHPPQTHSYFTPRSYHIS